MVKICHHAQDLLLYVTLCYHIFYYILYFHITYIITIQPLKTQLVHLNQIPGLQEVPSLENLVRPATPLRPPEDPSRWSHQRVFHVSMAEAPDMHSSGGRGFSLLLRD